MAADIGDRELVYCTILDIVDGKAGNKTIYYQHIGGAKDKHQWSADKNKFDNIYEDLEVGCNYLIVTYHYANKRWLWTRKWLLTKKELKLVMKLCGVKPSVDDLEDALTLIVEMRNPPKTPNLDDVLIF